MSGEIVLRPLAEVDLLEGVDWYEGKQAGLGAEFLKEVEGTLDRIREQPNLYAIVFEELREAIVHRFPYVVYYTLERDVVVVHAIIHSARDPAHWQSRLKR